MQLKKRYVVLLVVLSVMVAGVIGVTGFFRLSSETAALRHCVTKSLAGHYNKKIAVSVGAVTMGLARIGGRLVHMPPEAHAALESIQQAEVGVYKLERNPSALNWSAIFSRADQEMVGRGWERIIGLANEHELVAIYVPGKGLASHRVKCCLVVIQGQELIVASAKGNPEALVDLARSRLAHSSFREQLALR
jgi:hypothetical protein